MFRADWRTLGFVLTKLGLQSNPEIVNRKDPDGATCLMFAAMRGQLAIAEFLIDHAAAVDAQDSISGWTALMQVHAAPPLRSDFAPLAVWRHAHRGRRRPRHLSSIGASPPQVPLRIAQVPPFTLTTSAADFLLRLSHAHARCLFHITMTTRPCTTATIRSPDS